MPKYVKPNGKEITINDASVNYAESLGWKLVIKKEKEKKTSKKKDK